MNPVIFAELGCIFSQQGVMTRVSEIGSGLTTPVYMAVENVIIPLIIRGSS